MPSKVRYEIVLPIYYTQEFRTKKDKTFLVGLNWERNAHHFMKNTVKKVYHQLTYRQLESPDSPLTKFTVHTTVYWKNSSCDPRNVVPMIEKYALDALQLHGVLTNDNAKFDMGGTFSNGGQDKENPRCVIIIKEHQTIPNLSTSL